MTGPCRALRYLAESAFHLFIAVGNAGFTPTPWGYYGGLSFGAADKAYNVKLRGVTVADNRNTTVDGNTNNDGNSCRCRYQ